jgi:iron complex outermembrane recepter protein
MESREISISVVRHRSVAHRALLLGSAAHPFGGCCFSQGRYSSFPNITCYSGQTAALGCSPVTGFQDLSGKPLARAPDWTGIFGVSYERPAFGDWFIGLTADVRFSSGYFTELSDSIYAYQDAYYILNTSARLFTQDKRWELALIAKDLNDKQYATVSNDTPGGAPGTVGARISRPRQIIIQAAYHFL